MGLREEMQNNTMKTHKSTAVVGAATNAQLWEQTPCVGADTAICSLNRAWCRPHLMSVHSLELLLSRVHADLSINSLMYISGHDIHFCLYVLCELNYDILVMSYAVHSLSYIQRCLIFFNVWKRE